MPGNPEHHMDLRVHCAEPEGPNRELHQCLLNLVLSSGADFGAPGCSSA